MQEEKKNKHLTLEDRVEIQTCLRSGMSFKAIAPRIGRSPTTVSREAKARSIAHRNGFSVSPETCPLLLKVPFVCNGCSKCNNAGCRFVRRMYVTKVAQSAYEKTFVEAREGIPLTKESFFSDKRMLI